MYLKYYLKRFWQRLNRFIEYAPVIWRIEDYDYKYSVDLFTYQLARTAKYLKENGVHESAEVDAVKIKTAIDLLDKVYNEYYYEQPYIILERMYGEPDIEFEDLDENAIEFKGLQWPRAVDQAHNDEINLTLRDMLAVAHQRNERAHKLAWQYIGHNIRNWWD